MKADLHIHTVLSPCGDIEMTPANIVRRALEMGLGIIGITDHNSTLHTKEVRRIGEREGIFVMCGAEITTKEEVHVLAFVDGDEAIDKLQMFISENIAKIANDPDFFGYQLVVNENEEVVYEEDNLLISAINKSIDEVGEFVHSLGGIFIPAHIDKSQNSLLSQLGFIPPHLMVDALEVSPICNFGDFMTKNSYLSKYKFIRSSDAHYLPDVGRVFTELDIEKPSFDLVREAIKILVIDE